MNIKEQIKFDYADAKDNNHRLLRFALEDLIPLTLRRLNQTELLDTIESLIEKKGKEIIKKARKRKSVETEVFQMVIFNNYICSYRFDGKKRSIKLEYHEGQEHDFRWDEKREVEPKVIEKKRGFFDFI